MLKLQFFLALRNILKRKYYALIEISGLAIGLASFLLVVMYVQREFSYDTFFRDTDKIYRVLNHEQGSGYLYSGGASALGHHAATEISQVEAAVRIFFPYRMFSTSALVRYNDVQFYEDNIMEADSGFFSMFDFSFIAGNPRTALLHSDGIVLSEKAAHKLFGNEPALGKLISMDDENALQITAVVSVPENTHLNFDYLRPAHHDPAQLYVWEHTLAFTYLKIPDEKNTGEVEKQLHDLVLKHATDERAAYLKNYSHHLQPLRNVHTTILQWDIIQAVPARQVWAIFAIGVSILLLSVTNFINLATARTIERMKESGISKILGASQLRLVMQFFVEFLFVTLMAAVLALILLSGFIGLFNDTVGTSLNLSELSRKEMPLIIMSTVVVTALFSGLYPAYRLSVFKPTQVLKRTLTVGAGNLWFRQGLVLFQFVVSISLLTGTLLVQQQIHFLQKADLGFDRDNLYVMRMRADTHERVEQLKNSLLSNPRILKTGSASALLGGQPGSTTFHPDHMPEPTPETFAKNIAVDASFMDLIGVPLLEGRKFEIDNAGDYHTSYIINETAVKQFQLKDPVGSNFRRESETRGRIIGVMKDFHFTSMRESIKPMVFFMDSTLSAAYLFVKITGDEQETVSFIEHTWKDIFPEFPMEGFFQDQYFNSLYKMENQIAGISQWFTILSILLSSLGLLGMSSYIMAQRTKEIGIRKVVGASIADVLILLSKGFFKPIVIAFTISIPLTIYVMSNWLETFAKHIPIDASMFIIALIITGVAAVLTIGVQSFRAAIKNPTDALNQE